MAKPAAVLFWALALTSVQNVVSMDDEDGDWSDWGGRSGRRQDVMDDQDQEVNSNEERLTAGQLKVLLQKFDANKDGKATMQEIMAFAHEQRKKETEMAGIGLIEDMDTDKDNQLSLDEHLNHLTKHAMSWRELEKEVAIETAKFRAADENGDEVLTSSEIAALFFPEVSAKVLAISVQANMQMKDKDGDGKLTPAEFWGAFNEDGTADVMLIADMAEDFKKLDKDGDGLLNAGELGAWESGTFHTELAMLKLMEIADKDGDMAATFQELENARELILSTDAQYQLMEWAELPGEL